jgi:hydrogenase/urease accessory protein HupE
MRYLARNVLAAGAWLSPISAFAHSGAHRNEMAWSLVHAVTNADHMLVIGSGAALLAWTATVLLASKSERTASAPVKAR